MCSIYLTLRVLPYKQGSENMSPYNVYDQIRTERGGSPRRMNFRTNIEYTPLIIEVLRIKMLDN